MTSRTWFWNYIQICLCSDFSLFFRLFRCVYNTCCLQCNYVLLLKKSSSYPEDCLFGMLLHKRSVNDKVINFSISVLLFYAIYHDAMGCNDFEVVASFESIFIMQSDVLHKYIQDLNIIFCDYMWKIYSFPYTRSVEKFLFHSYKTNKNHLHKNLFVLNNVNLTIYALRSSL